MSERTSITDGPLGMEIVVRPRRDLGLRIFVPVWLGGWTFGEIAAIVTIVTAVVGGPRPLAGPEVFLVVWLIGWTVAGAFIWLAALYNFAGRERLVIDGTWLTIGRQLWQWSRPKRFPLSDVRRMRFSPPVYSRNNWSYSVQPWGLGGGSVAFEAGGGTLRFGSGLTEDESTWVINEINRRFPIAA